jgi:calcineurin-like phosphoesterase family protein
MKITLNPHQTLWFASDTHYSHKNICKGTSNWKDTDNCRNFETVEQMNNEMVSNINNVVMEDDILFHLGDWAWGEYKQIKEFRDRINCKNVNLILGNHDLVISKYLNTNNPKLNVRSLFKTINNYVYLTVRVPQKKKNSYIKYTFILMHYPIASWNGLRRGTIHLHGHIHSTPDTRITGGKAMDVGMDGNGLYPISLDEVVRLTNSNAVNFINLKI